MAEKMLMGVYGNRGSGKTLLITKLGLKHLDIPIKSNYKIDSPNYHPLEVFELLNLNPNNEPMCILIDEAYTWLESRVSPSKLNRYVSYIGFQSRKRSLDILYTAQLSSSIDLRFRDTEDYTIYCKDRPKPKTSKEDFKYVICKGAKRRRLTMKFKEGKKLFSKYNTDEVILPPDIEELQAEIEVLEPKKLNIETDKLVKLIEKENEFKRFQSVKDITHDVVKDILLRIGKPFVFEPYVYVRLRSKFNDS